jgi:hypothetical protein
MGRQRALSSQQSDPLQTCLVIKRNAEKATNSKMNAAKVNEMQPETGKLSTRCTNRVLIGTWTISVQSLTTVYHTTVIIAWVRQVGARQMLQAQQSQPHVPELNDLERYAWKYKSTDNTKFSKPASETISKPPPSRKRRDGSKGGSLSLLDEQFRLTAHWTKTVTLHTNLSVYWCPLCFIVIIDLELGHC